VVGLVGYLVGKALKVGRRRQQLGSGGSGCSWEGKERRFRKWSCGSGTEDQAGHVVLRKLLR
jgi:hypothetical protein